MHFSSICFIISFLWMFLIFHKWWFLKEVFKKKFEMSRRNFSVSSRPVIRHSTSCSLIVCLLLTMALGCAEHWEYHWHRAEPLRFQFKFSFMLALTTNNIISWRKPTIFSGSFPSIRFFYNSMRRNQWRNERMSNCRSKKHGWIEEKIISHRQKKKIQKKTIIRRSFKDSSIKQKWRQMRKISIQD